MSVPSQSVAPGAAAKSAPRPRKAPQPPAPVETSLTSDEARSIASKHGLRAMGVRPPFGEYVRSLWGYRSFIQVLATSKAYAKNRNNYLGQFWTILTPILNAAVYIIIFGFVLGTRAGIENVIAFIVIGTFVFRFFEHSVSSGAKAIRGNLSLVRSVRFPRAVLPISTVLTELTIFLPEAVVMCVITFGAGFVPGLGEVPITWKWLLLPAAIVLLWVFNTGCAFFMARWVAVAPDVQNLIGFVMRFIMYGSGVLFSISHVIKNDAVAGLLQHQPVAVFLYLFRACLANEPTVHMSLGIWLWAAGWAVAVFAAGFVYFWRGEERYGRD